MKTTRMKGTLFTVSEKEKIILRFLAKINSSSMSQEIRRLINEEWKRSEESKEKEYFRRKIHEWDLSAMDK